MSQSKKKLDIIRIVDVEKRKSPSKHYVYVIEVQWSDGSLCRIGRRFSAFFDMHMRLLEKFPLEGGQKDPSKRIIPYLPGKTLFQRSHTKEMTMKRLVSITEYCEALNNLPDKISQCDAILEFFKGDDQVKNKAQDSDSSSQSIDNITGPVELEPYRAIAEYTADDKTQISLNPGEIVDVIEKNENGWWLVCNVYGSNGWVPGAYLENTNGNKEDTEKVEPGTGSWYEAITTYKATSEDEISFPVGGALEVTEKTLDGWWLASFNGKEGWVPGSYLKLKNHPYSMSAPNGNIIQQSDERKEAKPAFGNGFMGSSYTSRKLPPKRSTVRRQVAPASKLKRNKEEPVQCNYVTECAFETTVEGGINFAAGETTKIIEQADNGWWYVSIHGEDGWVPANYLRIDTSQVMTSLNSSSSTKPATSPVSNKRFLTSTSNDVSKSSKASGQSKEVKKNKTPDLPPRPRFPGAVQSPSKKPASPLFSQRPLNSPASSRHADSSLERLSNFRDIQNFDKKSNIKLPDFEELKVRRPLRSNSGDQPLLPALKKSAFADKDNQVDDELWFKDVSREEVEKALTRENKEGYFLVRRSKAGGANVPYSITLYHQNTIFNFHIRKRRDGMFATGVFSEGEKCFKSVKDLVGFYKTNTLVVGDYRNLVKLTGNPHM